MEETQDKINPSHYKPTGDATVLDKMIRLGDLQVIDVIELFGLGYHLGNVVKYTFRAGKKEELGYDKTLKAIEDCSKAAWYLNREIERLQRHKKAISDT